MKDTTLDSKNVNTQKHGFLHDLHNPENTHTNRYPHTESCVKYTPLVTKSLPTRPFSVPNNKLHSLQFFLSHEFLNALRSVFAT